MQLFRWYGMEECQYMISMKQLGFSMRKMIFPSVTQVTQKKKKPVFQKANLDGMIFAFDYHARLACVKPFDHPHAHNFHLRHPQCVVRM